MVAFTGGASYLEIKSNEIFNAHNAIAATPSDSTPQLGRGVWVYPTVPATPGTVALMPINGTVSVSFPVPANSSFFIPLAVRLVMSTGTSGVTAIVFI